MTNKIKYLAICVVLSTGLISSGCTSNQQDKLFNRAVEMARGQVGMTVKATNAGDVNLTYMERPASSSKPTETILLLHGFSANKDNWIGFTKALDAKYRVIAVDLAGHGDSDKSLTTDYGLIKQAQRLNIFTNNLGIEKFHIAGNSMGGAISSIFSFYYPEKLKSLTLIDAAGVDGSKPSEYYQALAKGTNPLIPVDKESFEFRMDFTMSQPPTLPWPLRPAFYRKTIARVDINQKIFSDMLATREQLSSDDFKTALKNTMEQYQLPTLIMWGKEDRVLDVSAVAELKQVIPSAKVHIFEDVGHLPMVEIPDESAEVYQNFLSSLEQ